MSKVLLLSRDPGGANTVIPLVRELQMRGYKTVLLGKDSAVKRYRDEGLEYVNIGEKVNKEGARAIKELLEANNPDFVITGTSADDMAEKNTWTVSSAMGIRSFAIVEQWVNFGIRFSKYGLSDLAQYEANKEHPFLPTKILVSDDLARKGLIADGITDDRIIITGNPYFEYMIERAKEIGKDKIRTIRGRMGIDESDQVITFVSEPISKMYSRDTLGYDEKTIVRSILRELLPIVDEKTKGFVFVIRLHPKDVFDHYRDIIAEFSGKIRIVTDTSNSSQETILASDVVCGMYSMLLMEAVLLGKPISSVQIGLKRENPFILDRLGVQKSILDEKELRSFLEKVVIGKNARPAKFNYIKNASKNVVDNMEKLLCQN